MESLTERLAELGRDVARVSDEDAETERVLAEATRRLGPAIRGARGRSRRASLLLAAAVAVAAMVVWFSAGQLRGPDRLEYRVRGQAPAGAERGFIEAKQAIVTVDFAGGSVVEIAPQASLRVLAARASGVELLVERGAVDFAVASAAGQRWTVRAGPYEVHVTGTRFEAGWDPERARFHLRMQEGAVDVEGPHVPGLRRVIAGEHMEIFLGDGRMSLQREEHLVAASSAATGPSAAPIPAPAPSTSAVVAPAASASVAMPPLGGEATWQEAARRGRYAAALASVDVAGFETLLARSDREETRLLADTARLGGRPAQARLALVALRERHGVRGETAYLLGKIAADQLRAPGEAMRWFDVYLAEAPRGPLREQALGRVMELGRGEPTRARRAAERYLSEYPEGAYAPLAKTLVERSRPR